MTSRAGIRRDLLRVQRKYAHVRDYFDRVAAEVVAS